MALTFLTHIISDLGGVMCLLTYYVFQEKRKMKSIDSRLSFPWLWALCKMNGG